MGRATTQTCHWQSDCLHPKIACIYGANLGANLSFVTCSAPSRRVSRRRERASAGNSLLMQSPPPSSSHSPKSHKPASIDIRAMALVLSNTNGIHTRAIPSRLQNPLICHKGRWAHRKCNACARSKKNQPDSCGHNPARQPRARFQERQYTPQHILQQTATHASGVHRAIATPCNLRACNKATPCAQQMKYHMKS